MVLNFLYFFSLLNFDLKKYFHFRQLVPQNLVVSCLYLLKVLLLSYHQHLKNLKRKKIKIISNKERNLKKLARKAIYLAKNKKKK